MSSASFLFSAVFRLRNPTREIFSELHGTITPDLILLSRTRKPKERRRGAMRPPHNLVARPHLLAREEVVWGPQGAPGLRPSPIYTPSPENPKYLIIIPWKVPSLPSSSTLDREGSGALPGTLPERRSSPEGSTSPCLPPVWCVSSSSLDYGSIAVARWLYSPLVPSCLDPVSFLSWSRSSYCNATYCVCKDPMNNDVMIKLFINLYICVIYDLAFSLLLVDALAK